MKWWKHFGANSGGEGEEKVQSNFLREVPHVENVMVGSIIFKLVQGYRSRSEK